MKKMEILQQIKQGIYHGTLNKDDVLEMIRIAEENILKDKENECNHNYVYVTEGYGFERCSKCYKIKTT